MFLIYCPFLYLGSRPFVLKIFRRHAQRLRYLGLGQLTKELLLALINANFFAGSNIKSFLLVLDFQPFRWHFWCACSFLARHEHWYHLCEGWKPHMILGFNHLTETLAFRQVHTAHQVCSCLSVGISVESGSQGACFC